MPNEKFSQFINWGLILLVFLLPLFFLPVTTEFYEFNKNILLYCFIALLLIAWTLKMVMEKRVTFRRTPFDLPVLTIAATFTISTLIVSTNKWETLWMPGGIGTILALTVLYFLITNNLPRQDTPGAKGVITSLTASASLLSLIAIYQFIGVGEILIPVGTGQAFDWLRNRAFSPAGGLLPLASFLVVALTLTITRIYTNLKTNRHEFLLYLNIFVSLLIASGLGITVYQLATTARPILLPQSAGWVIALEAFKRFPLFGVGVENFSYAFTTGKPIDLNLNQFWALRFSISSNFYFHLLTTTGILGLAAWGFLIWKVIKIGPTRINTNRDELLICLFVIFILFALLPANFLLLTTVYILLALLGAASADHKIEKEGESFGLITLIIALLATGVTFYGLARVLQAEIFFRQSLVAASENRGPDTYNLQIQAIQTNPYKDIYRMAYSQTNLAIASAIASNPSASGLTDQDRQNISSLIQQAIREGKTAIALGANRAQNWENLANLYRNLINFAQGADNWAIESYNQAISLDPTNPILRLNLGGVYFALKNYDEAIRQFTITVNLKPNYANGHYNLAAAYREKQMIAEAIREMEQTRALVEPGTNDYQKTTTELEDLRAKLPREEEKTASPSGIPETLTQPATSPAGLKPPLKLPEEVQPEVGTPSGR